MALFTVTLGKSRKRFKLVADNPEELSLLIAMDLPDEWFGLTVVKDTQPNESGTFLCNAVKAYYDEVSPGKTAIELATEQYVSRVRFNQPELIYRHYHRYDEVFSTHSLKYAIENKLIKEIK